MNRDQKCDAVSSLKEGLLNNSFIVIVHYCGMSDKQIYDMRVALKAKNCSMKVIKNTLAKIAVKGTEFEALESYLVGPTAILYSTDPVALAKILSDTAKRVSSLKIQIGYLNQLLIKESVVSDLAKLGSLEDVRANFIGKINAVASNFLRIVKAPSEGNASSFSNSSSN